MTMISHYRNLLNYLSLLFLLVIGACGNENEDESQLTAYAGEDINVQVGQQVTLNGLGSIDMNGNPFEFSWEFITKPSLSNIELTNSTTGTPTFTPDQQGKYKVELTVSNTAESKDTVLVSAFKAMQVDGIYENLFPGPNVGVRDFATFEDCLIATCEFTEIGGIEAKKIACFNGSGWSPLGCGLEEGSIYDMIEYKGELYATGQFDEIGCIPANNIARWDGVNWKDVEGGLTGGDNPFGYTLEIYEDELYVGGQFTQAGDVSVSNIAKWNGEEWSAVGTIEDGSVRELRVYKGELYAGGFFTMVNGVNIEYIASYNGASWSDLGSRSELVYKTTGVVRHMAVFQDVLYISGDFEVSNQEFSELVTWNGSQFNDFGRAFSRYLGNAISELAAIDDILYIGGSFHNVVGSQANNILLWDGENWGIMSEGISGVVLSIELFNGKIYIGGDFEIAGGENAEHISIWTEE